MLVRQKLSWWLVMTGFVASIVATVPVCRLLRPPTAPPQTLAELTQLLRQSNSSLLAVPVIDFDLEAGVYLCESPKPREQLQCLQRDPAVADKWQGIVFCERIGTKSEVSDVLFRFWGEHAMHIGPLVFFGDPNLLRSIHRRIFPRSEEKP